MYSKNTQEEQGSSSDVGYGESFWNSLTDEQRVQAFCAISRRIVQAEIKDRGSFRYTLFNIFKFPHSSYVPAYESGYMKIHNTIFEGLQLEDIGNVNKDLIRSSS